MNTEHPHDIRRFADGEPIPDGYVELTEEDVEELDKMAVDERAEWLRKNKERTPLGTFKDALNATKAFDPDKEGADLERKLRREREEFQRKHGAKGQARGPAPPITPRQHRSQGR